MNKIDLEILNIDKVICGNIDKFNSDDRGILSQNILSQLRNFVEHISLKVYGNGSNVENTYENIKKAIDYVKARGNLSFLSRFHRLLQIVASHYTLDEENSERLMLKYYEYLLRIKEFFKTSYNIDVISNIDEFPITMDSNLKEYYERISEKINQNSMTGMKNTHNDRYYIQKIKPFFVKHKIYYEVTFSVANDKSSKFDRIIAFTKLDIPHNYAVKFSVINDNINILGKDMPILIIENYEVSLRPCELDNFTNIFGVHPKIQGNSVEYRELMIFLTITGMNLVELLDFSDAYYLHCKNRITEKAKASHFFNIFDKFRELVKRNAVGSNVIRYLLYRLNNKIIKQQYSSDGCKLLSNLCLHYGCIPFDKMPFTTSLINHNPKLSDLLDCIDVTNREHEIFARFIKNNTEMKGNLYASQKDISKFENIDELIDTYNERLYTSHINRRLEKYNDNIYIKGYEIFTINIIKKLQELSKECIKNYSNSVEFWLKSTSYNIDSDEKETALKQMFENSCVALIYGSAGTGKSTLINHVSNFFNDTEKLYLANTNPAVDNLKRRTNAANCTFKTISKFLNQNNCNIEFDLLIIDECSTVSNSDMLKVLDKATFKLLVLVGDVFQIESIIFGNWFDIVRGFVPKEAVFELTTPFRSNNSNLIALWDRVRNMDDAILELLTKNAYSVTLNESIFEHFEEDEIILCLNYDGLYGINNINKFLQCNNENEAVQWGIQTYKIDDPVLFNESERFAPLIYNNLKGKIVDIEILDKQIQFDIELEKVINQFAANKYDFQLLENSDKDHSVIRFCVNSCSSGDEDDDLTSDAVVPFQIAYAVSIHKAQGLEYKSVKIVITDEIEEMISHNIFYTAITRAKETLKIYWTPETENKILNNLKRRDNRRDIALLSTKYGL